MALSTNALCTLADLKSNMRITVSTYDTLLEAVIERISADIQRYLGRTLLETAYTEYYAGTGRQWLCVDNYPIVSITSIKVDDTLIAATDYECYARDKARGMIFKGDGWTDYAYLVGLVGEPAFSSRPYEVKYTAGYLTPAASGYSAPPTGSIALPKDIQGACLGICQWRYRKMTDDSAGLQSLTEGGLSYTWKDEPLPQEYLWLIDTYKKRSAA